MTIIKRDLPIGVADNAVTASAEFYMTVEGEIVRALNAIKKK